MWEATAIRSSSCTAHITATPARASRDYYTNRRHRNFLTDRPPPRRAGPRRRRSMAAGAGGAGAVRSALALGVVLLPGHDEPGVAPVAATRRTMRPRIQRRSLHGTQQQTPFSTQFSPVSTLHDVHAVAVALLPETPPNQVIGVEETRGVKKPRLLRSGQEELTRTGSYRRSRSCRSSTWRGSWKRREEAGS